ncbi:hypothetical protein C8A05DRAFT_37745 [Staphylotrichum tortipilum]|uniref:Uncharacterized protein n=1 Tax=Staphylotrichum tortipilum TaxID=2831512 RepID=A0AAN6MEJ9_9PEZI|nr:hypothetical protein C8A05DRAFT_37745 [Staphylotrichum longicolle]
MPMGSDGPGWGWGWDVPHITGNGTFWGDPGLYELPETSTATTTSATTTRTTQTQTQTPTPIMNRADPNTNQIHCFNSGQKMTNSRLHYGRHFRVQHGPGVDRARALGPKARGHRGAGPFMAQNTLPFSESEEIHWTFEVKEGCAWTFDFDECLRYLKTSVDSCDCSGENSKRGGYGENNCLSWMFDPNKTW